MKTQYFFVNKDNPDISILKQASEILRNGGLVAFPTETVYGLGANGLDAEAVEKIYQAKGRPSDNPLILHISSITELEQLAARISPQARTLINKYWPGPLTVVLEKSTTVPDNVTGGLETVAVRMPDSKTARELIRLAGIPLAAPSANTSGRPSPTNAQAVLADLSGRIDAIVDAGSCVIGLESTVIDLTGETPRLLRPGIITHEMLTDALGRVEVCSATEKNTDTAPKSPGMKYVHYSPKYPMVLVQDTTGILLKQKIDETLSENKKAGAIVSAETAKNLSSGAVVAIYGSRANLRTIAAGLYDALRYFDNHEVDVIFAEGIEETGLGTAIMNRLRKAAAEEIQYK
jgi:L-threonylcarbamoyladenylate synthase